MEDCKKELHALLVEEVWSVLLMCICTGVHHCEIPQRLAGATLLVFANKQDLPGAMDTKDIKEVSRT